MKQIDLRPFDKQIVISTRNAFERIEEQAKYGVSYTLIDENGDIIVIGGVVSLWDGVGSGWVLTSSLLLKYKIWCHRVIRDVLSKAEIDCNLHRIESIILKEHEVSMKWAERLGFEQEGLLRKYDSLKQDHWLYARVR